MYAGLLQAPDKCIQARAVVTLVGNIDLGRALSQSFSASSDIVIQQYKTLAELPVIPDVFQTRLVVALSTRWQPADDDAIQRWCKEQQIAFLRVSIWQHEAVVGPLVLPDTPGCVECAERRRLRAKVFETANELHFLEWYKNEMRTREYTHNPLLTDTVLNIVSTFAAADIEAFLAQNLISGIHTVHFLSLRSLVSKYHHFLPDPLCTICGTPADDCAEDALIHFEPRIRPADNKYRLRTLQDDLETLEARYIDRRLGIQITSATSDVFARALTHFREYPYSTQTITCTGIAHSIRSSRTIAIAEALERYSSLIPRGKRSVVYGSYRQLQERAIDPEQFGLYSPAQYEQQKKHFPRFIKYHPDLSLCWVWAYSLRNAQPVLIPEQIAYFSSSVLHPESQLFILDNSNGCAVGSSIEEASLFGLFEVIERDAFLLTWYARLRLPAIDWRSTRDVNLLLSLERSQLLTGMKFFAFDATTDIGLPVIIAVAVHPEDEAPKVHYSAAAHFDPDQALASAFYEITSVLSERKRLFVEKQEKAEQLLKDSSLILSIEDHVLAAGMPAAFSRLNFLLWEQAPQSMQERFAVQYKETRSPDLTKNFLHLSQRIIERGYDVVIVNQTAPELQESNLHCVRVLVPGLLPMTFGHDFRRTYGLKRLYHLPKQLGYTDHILNDAEINQDPHGFA